MLPSILRKLNKMLTYNKKDIIKEIRNSEAELRTEIIELHELIKDTVIPPIGG